MRLELKPGAVLVFAAVSLVAPSLKLALLLLASVVLHEVSHAIVAALCGSKVKAIGVNWTGTYIRREDTRRPRLNLLISLSGPLANLAIAAIAIGWLSHMNLILALGNLLPLPHSDGARAWHAISESVSG